jgi:hypothetical protein
MGINIFEPNVKISIKLPFRQLADSCTAVQTAAGEKAQVKSEAVKMI